MALLSSGQKRKQKERKRKKKQLLQKNNKLAEFSIIEASTSKDLPKLSAAIIDYAGPLLDVTETEEDVCNAFGLATLFWNIGTYPDSVSRGAEEELLDQMMEELDASDEEKDVMRTFYAFMIEGRRTIFGEDHRFVLDYEILWNDGDFRLRAFSSLVPPPIFEDLTGMKPEQEKARLRHEFEESH